VTVAAPQILLVDDNPTNLQILYQTLEGQGYRLLAARSGKDAIAIAERAAPDLILLDVMMPDPDGFETCARLKADARTRDCAIIFLSALNDARDRAHGLDLGAVDFVNKPFQAEEILARVKTHLTIRELQQQLQQRNAALEHELTVAQELLREARDRTDGVLLGESAAAVRLRHAVREAAASDETWLINGPPGSDHEAVARAIHHQSKRTTRAIIVVNCLALTSDSTAARAGTHIDLFDKLHLATGGTLYIEGIEHLPPDAQMSLVERLRVINGAQDRAARTAVIPSDVDVRMLVSTTHDVDEAVAGGRIIPELRRVLSHTLDLAPLRARLDDVAVLAPYILRRQAEQAGRTAPILSEESLKRLQNYRWPGNLRELRNVLGFALSTSQGGVLEIGEQLLDNNLRVGSYSLLERLGSGGMGDVWLARHHLLARPAAVKIIREAALGGGEDGPIRRQRFAREAQATSELQSPHTVQLYDFGVTDAGGFYYVMERLRGMDLKRLVERHGPQSPERVVFLLRQVCVSLSEAHALGLVHRDIKPANLFACRLGSEYDFVKVVDFGVVSRHASERAQITTAGMILGTPAFLAPELVSNQMFDGRADVYALGCVAFWLLTGRPPFEAADAMSILMHHAQTAPSAPSTMSEEPIPPQLDALVLECLEKDPARRPSADALWERLDRIPLTREWNQQHARIWWEMHEPELVTSS
jgi:DNA-binding NtrC family response regulator